MNNLGNIYASIILVGTIEGDLSAAAAVGKITDLDWRNSGILRDIKGSELKHTWNAIKDRSSVEYN